MSSTESYTQELQDLSLLVPGWKAEIQAKFEAACPGFVRAEDVVLRSGPTYEETQAQREALGIAQDTRDREV